MKQLVNVGDFCPNEGCIAYGKLQEEQSKKNIKKHGFTAAGMQRFQIVFETLKQRGHPDKPPPTISDGWGGIREAMVEVYGQVATLFRSRPPAHPQASWVRLAICANGQTARKWPRHGHSITRHLRS